MTQTTNTLDTISEDIRQRLESGQLDGPSPAIQPVSDTSPSANFPDFHEHPLDTPRPSTAVIKIPAVQSVVYIAQFREQVVNELQRGCSLVIVDLADVIDLSMAFLGRLVAAHSAAHKSGVQLMLA